MRMNLSFCYAFLLDLMNRLVLICMVKQLFREYFYSVVLYKERKPGIYLKFDAHMKQVLDMEFFKRIIKRYMESESG